MKAINEQSTSTGLPRRVSFTEALRFWIKLGFISFGGPAGQIAIMHRELVEKKRWLSEERFLHALNYCMILPGPEAQQLAIYIGWLMHRTWGGIVAGAFFVIPSIFILLALSYIYAAHGNVPAIAGVLDGFKPVVVAIVVEALLKIGRRALKREVHYAVAALAFISIFFLQVPFPVIVLAAGLTGLIGIWYLPSAFTASTEKDKSPTIPNVADLSTLIIDDNVAPAEHTIPNRTRLLKILAIGILMWIAPLVALVIWNGTNSLHVHEYSFFTQSALVTFGGAYAVLAYVTQAITAPPYNWISPVQAVDGLALAETTPGPLIMVLQFVGFMAGWNHPPDGVSQISSAVLGALVATYATFLPSFLFIFLGAPYIEYLRGKKSLTGALSGVTAAVVGVILNLAMVFGAAVIFPDGISGSADWFAVILSSASFIALFKFKIGVFWVILIGGLIGLSRVFLFESFTLAIW